MAYRDKTNFKKIEINLKMISFVFLNNQILRKIDFGEFSCQNFWENSESRFEAEKAEHWTCI